MSARKSVSVSVSVSAPWNASLTQRTSERRACAAADDDSLSDWSSPAAAAAAAGRRSDVAVCSSTWRIVDVVSGDASTYAACQTTSVPRLPQPDRTYTSSSNRLAVHFIGSMTSPSTTPASSAAHRHDDDRVHDAAAAPPLPPLQLLHFTGREAPVV